MTEARGQKQKPLCGKTKAVINRRTPNEKTQYFPGHPCGRSRSRVRPAPQPAPACSDAAGRTADVSLAPSVTEILFALDMGDHIVAQPTSATIRPPPRQLNALAVSVRRMSKNYWPWVRTWSSPADWRGRSSLTSCTGGNPSSECARDRLYRQLPRAVRRHSPNWRGHRPLVQGPKTYCRHARQVGRRGRASRPDRRRPATEGLRRDRGKPADDRRGRLVH